LRDTIGIPWESGFTMQEPDARAGLDPASVQGVTVAVLRTPLIENQIEGVEQYCVTRTIFNRSADRVGGVAHPHVKPSPRLLIIPPTPTAPA